MENTTYMVTVDTAISVLDLGKAAEHIGCVLRGTPQGELRIEKRRKRKNKEATPVMMFSTRANDPDNFAPSPDSGVIA